MTAPVDVPLVTAIFDAAYASRDQVIEAIGEVMLAADAVLPAYVDGMLRKEAQASTIVTAEVALPHGTADVRHAVLRNVLVVVPIPGGVAWTAKDRVRLAIGFAGTGDKAHLRLLGSVARVLADEQRVARLKTATARDQIAAVLEDLEQ